MDLNVYESLMLKHGIENPPDIEDIELNTEIMSKGRGLVCVYHLEYPTENGEKVRFNISYDAYCYLKEFQEGTTRKRFAGKVLETLPDAIVDEHSNRQFFTMKTKYGNISYKDKDTSAFWSLPRFFYGTLDEVIEFAKRYTDLCNEFWGNNG